MSSVQQPACLALCALVAAASCASQQPSSREEDRLDEGSSESPQRPVAASSDLDGEDQRCAQDAREAAGKLCSDAPPSLPEGYAARARRAYEQIAGRCDGMRARAALRELDECVFSLEESPSQIDLETSGRREAASERVAELKADPLYAHARKRLRQALEEVEGAEREYERALDRGTPSEVRFRAESWEQAEEDLASARKKLRGMLDEHQIDPRDARALGLW